MIAALRRLGALNCVVIGMALALPAGGYAVLESLRSIAGRFALDAQISVFLAPEAKRAEAQALGKVLRADSRVAKLRFVPREDALQELSAVAGMPEVIAALGSNPLPDTYVVTSRQGMLDALTADLGKLPGVAHVQADALWARRLAAAAAIGRLAVWLLAGVLAVGLVAVTFNTIRLQILTQREEIEVCKLIGATDAFVRRPFYYLGFLQGMVGGLVALGLVAAAFALLNREVAALAESYGSGFRLTSLSLAQALGVIGVAGFLGGLGAHLSVNRHLEALSA